MTLISTKNRGWPVMQFSDFHSPLSVKTSIKMRIVENRQNSEKGFRFTLQSFRRFGIRFHPKSVFKPYGTGGCGT